MACHEPDGTMWGMFLDQYRLRHATPLAAELMQLFRLSATDAALADRMFTTVTVEPGTELAWMDGVFKQLILVLDGEVEVLRDDEQIAVLGAGGVIGEITALGVSRTQVASARALTACRVAAAGQSDIAQLRNCTGLYLHLQHLASRRTVAVSA